MIIGGKNAAIILVSTVGFAGTNLAASQTMANPVKGNTTTDNQAQEFLTSQSKPSKLDMTAKQRLNLEINDSSQSSYELRMLRHRARSLHGCQ